MPQGPNPRLKIYTLPQTWYGRLLATVVGAVVLLLAIFFFTFFLIIFVVAAIVMTVYLSLFGRKYEEPAPPESFRPDMMRPDIIRVENLLDNTDEASEDRDTKKDNSV